MTGTDPPDGPERFGPAWLEALASGEFPLPIRPRWQPLRVGIVRLWEYEYEEFWFADGRLALRGGNGAGKTKVLELTTLMLMRGEIGASVLDPFGSQHRTMRFNLLPTGDGDDPRPPADSGLGYAWVEFGLRDSAGHARYLVCGMGVSARRGTGTGSPETWHFITSRRPRKGLDLVVGGRAIEQKELRRIDGVDVPRNAAAYRARLAHDLFGLASESYDNLTDLLKQLRRPKLGERLNPGTLAEMLRDALPPLAGYELDQLADGWENLEQLRRSVEHTEAAATATAGFVRYGWSPWARTVLRRRADQLSSATTVLDNTTRDRMAAEQGLGRAREELADAQRALVDTQAERRRRDVELRELLDNTAYQQAAAASGRVDSLREAMQRTDERVESAESAVAGARALLSRAEEGERSARSATEKAGTAVGSATAALSEVADRAGLRATLDRSLTARGTDVDIDAIVADHGVRTERFAHLQRLGREHADARVIVEKVAELLLAAESAVAAARAEQAQAQADVERQVERFRDRIRDWATSATGTALPSDVIVSLCDDVAGLTEFDPGSGRLPPGSSVVERMRTEVGTARTHLVGRRHALDLERDPVSRQRQRTAAALAEATSRTDRPPEPPSSWRRRERPSPERQAGAPFWRLANPAPGLAGDGLDRLEAAMAASGLLDAWITPDGAVLPADDGPAADVQARPGARSTDRTLRDVLEPDTAGGVPAAVVGRVLDGVGWWDGFDADRPGDWLSADGGWRIGGLCGGAAPAGPAAHLGAAAREAARQREIETLTAELVGLDDVLARLDARRAELADALGRLDEEENRLPADEERVLVALVASLAERSRQALRRDGERAAVQTRYDDSRAAQDRAWAEFARYAADHAFGLDDLPAQESSLRAFGERLSVLSNAVDVLVLRQEALECGAENRVQRESARDDAVAERDRVVEQRRSLRIQLSTAESAVGADRRELLDRRDRLDSMIEDLDGFLEALVERRTDLSASVATAMSVLDQHEQRRAEADTARDAAMRGLNDTVEAGLLASVPLPVPARWTVQSARDLAVAIRRETGARTGLGDEDENRAWQRCNQQLLILRQQLVPNRDARTIDEDVRFTRFEVFSDPLTGWQDPLRAADALAEQVLSQRKTFDTEQQRVLTTLLGSTFIEHLKERLDYATRTFARINERLADHPTRHGNVVRVLHEPDPSDPDAGAVVAALERGYEHLSPERQNMVRDYLARKIDEARADAEAGEVPDWKEELGRALDYRRWLRLSLQYRPGPGSPWAPFDAARHASKSGGEKVVLLSQPLFAAAVVAYDAAGLCAPRWIWLDEAMTGVDTEVKASFMGLTVDFELDVMLTAHDEWCRYRTVPVVAVYDLFRHEHLAGVDVVPYLWCGGEWSEAQRPDPGTAGTSGLTGGLFGEPEDDGPENDGPGDGDG